MAIQRGTPLHKPPTCENCSSETANHPEGLDPIFVGVGCVSFIFILDIGVLWALSKIGGEKLKADVRATIKKFGGSIVIAGAGLVGCFLAIAFVAFGGLWLVSWIMK
jgi:hypothetical protein